MSSLEINPQTMLVIGTSRVQGGKRITTRTIDQGSIGEGGEGTYVERQQRIEVDDREERARAESIVGAATHVIRRASVATLIGQLSPRERLPEIEAGLAEVRARAESFNDHARTCRVTIGMISLEISIALGPESARALADHVRGELTTLRDQLRAGDIAKCRSTMLRARNIDQLAVGVQAESIRFALDEAKERISDLAHATSSKRSAPETPESAGRSLDLSMIEAAIGMFTYDRALLALAV